MNIKTTYKNESKKLHKKTRSFKKTKLKQYGGQSYKEANFIPIKITGIVNDCWLEASIQLLWCIDPLQEYFKEVTKKDILDYKLNNTVGGTEDIILDAMLVFKSDKDDKLVLAHASRSDGIASAYINTIKDLILAFKAIFKKYDESVTENKQLVDLQEVNCSSIDKAASITVSSSLQNCLTSLNMPLHLQHDPAEFIEKFLRGLTYFSECANLCKTYTSISRFMREQITYSSEYKRYDDLYREIYINKTTPITKKTEWASSLLHDTLVSPANDQAKFYKACMAVFNDLTLDINVLSADAFNKSVSSYIRDLEAQIRDIESQLGLKTEITSIKVTVILDNIPETLLKASKDIATLTASINTSGPIQKLQTIIIQLISYILKQDIDADTENKYEEHLSENYKFKDTTMISILIITLLGGFTQYRNSGENLNVFIQNSLWFNENFPEAAIVPAGTIASRELVRLLFNAFDQYIFFSEIDIFKNLDYYYKNRATSKIPYDILLDPIVLLAAKEDTELGDNNIEKMIIEQKSISELAYFKDNRFLILRINRTSKDGSNVSKAKITPDHTITVNENKYRLRSCIVHTGTNATGGHYRYIVYNDDGEAKIMLDGSKSESVSNNESILKQGYIYLYEMIKDDAISAAIMAKVVMTTAVLVEAEKRETDAAIAVEEAKKAVDAVVAGDDTALAASEVALVAAKEAAVVAKEAAVVARAEAKKAMDDKVAAEKVAAEKAAETAAEKVAAEKAAEARAAAERAVVKAAETAAEKVAAEKAAEARAAAARAAAARVGVMGVMGAPKVAEQVAASNKASGRNKTDTNGTGDGKTDDVITGDSKNVESESDDPGDSSQDNTGENIVLGVLLCVTLVISTVMLL